jgi:hypothetical protein
MRSKIFSGCPETRSGYLWPDGYPVPGANLASGYPLHEDSLNGGWPALRRIDGTVIRS